MKAEEPNSDRKADVLIRADGTICTEYYESIDNNGAYTCYIPVQTGQYITVNAALWGKTNNVHFDLIVDGILRNSHTVGNKVWKNIKRGWKVSTGFYLGKFGVEKGDMCPVALDTLNNAVFHDQGTETVGVIELQISCRRSPVEGSHQMADMPYYKTSRGWKQEFDRPGFSKVKPTHEMMFAKNDEQPTKMAISRLHTRTKLTTERPGVKPWLTVKFFYRSLGKQVSLNT
jgi:hypothetical protein